MKTKNRMTTISITWDMTDVIEQAKSRDITITEDQACDILEMMLNEHDANVGINWETIDVCIDYYLNELKKKEEVK